MEQQTIGFIGLGMMGLPMVENLANQVQLRIYGHDRNPANQEKLDTLPGKGKTVFAATGLADLAECGIVFLMLPNSPITNEVVLGSERNPGLMDVLKPGTIIVDMGSSNPIDTRANAKQLAARNIELLDAPVSGAVVKARSGKLAIMVGGSEAAYSRVSPLLKHMGETVIRTGEAGSAHAMKALNNYVYAAGLLAASEALQIARRLNLNPDVFADVLQASSGRNVATETKLRQFLIPENFAGGFALRLQAKDLATAAALQQATGFDAPQLSLCNGLWQSASQALPADADNTSIYRYLGQKQT